MVVGLRIERLLEMLLEKEGRRANHSLMPCRCALVNELLLTAAEAQRPCRSSPCTLHAHVLARSAATGHYGGAAPLHGCAAAAEVRTQPPHAAVKVRTQPPPTNVEAWRTCRPNVCTRGCRRPPRRRTWPPLAAIHCSEMPAAAVYSTMGAGGRGMAAWGAAGLLVDLVQNWAILGSRVGEEGDGDSTILGPEERRLTICYVSFSYFEYLKRYILSIYKKLLKIKGIQLNTLELT